MSDQTENDQSQSQPDGIVIEDKEYSDEEMHALIDGTITEFDEGDLVNGVIVKVERDEVLLDIGYKSEGVIPARELSIRKDVDPGEIVSTGDEVEALVLQKEDKDGRLILSKKRAEYERAWVSVENKFNDGENVQGEVIEVVKGGLILDIGLRGFLPASLVDLRRVKDLSVYLGDSLECRVIEMDRNRNNVVLSRRVVLEEDRRAERQEILTKLVKGQILPGQVSSIVDFGAFVDLGGIDGLVHISELSWNHVNHPSEVISVGDDVEVQVLDVDLDRERISLGLKQTQEDPGKELVKEFPVGTIVEGRVTKTVPFGAFIELAKGVEGLVHISEMARGHVEKPEDMVSVEDTVHVKVMDVETDRRRISLSMQAAAEELGLEIEPPPSAEAEGDEAAEAEAPEAEGVETEAETPEEPVEAAGEEVVEVEAIDETEEATAEIEEEPEEAVEPEVTEEPEVADEAEEAAEEAPESVDEVEAVAESEEPAAIEASDEEPEASEEPEPEALVEVEAPAEEPAAEDSEEPAAEDSEEPAEADETEDEETEE